MQKLASFDEFSSEFSVTSTRVTSSIETASQASYFEDFSSTATTICSTSTSSLSSHSLLKIEYLRYESDKGGKDEEETTESEKFFAKNLSETDSSKSIFKKNLDYRFKTNGDVDVCASYMNKELSQDTEVLSIQRSPSAEKLTVCMLNPKIKSYTVRKKHLPISKKLRKLIRKKEKQKSKTVFGIELSEQDIKLKKVKLPSKDLKRKQEQVYRIALMRRIKKAVTVAYESMEKLEDRWYLSTNYYSDNIFEMFDMLDEVAGKYIGMNCIAWISIIEMLALEKLTTKGSLSEKYYWIMNELVKFRNVVELPDYVFEPMFSGALCCDETPMVPVKKTVWSLLIPRKETIIFVSVTKLILYTFFYSS